MALVLFQRAVIWEGESDPDGNDTILEWYVDTDTDTVPPLSPYDVPHGTIGDFLPPFGTLIYSDCVSGDLIQYTTKLIDGDHYSDALHYLNKTTTPNSTSCCTISGSDFSAVKTNNTSAGTPNGSIVVTSSLIISDYEASINNGASWVSPVGSSITFSGLPAGTYNIKIREVSGVCSATLQSIISDNISYPPLIISEWLSHLPNLYSPVFYPIEIGFKLTNNTATVREDVNGTYLEVDNGNEDAREYLRTLPIIRVIGSPYTGKYQITGTNDPDTPTKFYIDATFSTVEGIFFVPFDRQVFQLFAEKAFNVFAKIADIAVYADGNGEYLLRIEGFLQSVFQIEQPVNNGDEITLLRKYYVVPRDFDMIDPPTIFNAVYSAIPDLTTFLGDLIPLGPAPINFINEQTNKGMPVLFSYIDTTVGRIKNITSSEQTNIYSTLPVVYIPAIPLNTYDFTWVNPAGNIGSLNVTPALPDWITIIASAPDTVKLHIDTGEGSTIGDYDPEDYDSDDYLTGGLNAIVGCYSFTFKDGVTTLFELSICIFPVQSASSECLDGFNIAWINQEGGWSSYVFGGRKTFGKEIGNVKTFKRGNQLRRASVSDVYNTSEATIAVKSKQDIDFISSLRQSVQAFLYSDNTQQWSIPIILDNKSFTMYSTPFKQIEVNDTFKFRYAEEILIQNQ